MLVYLKGEIVQARLSIYFFFLACDSFVSPDRILVYHASTSLSAFGNILTLRLSGMSHQRKTTSIQDSRPSPFFLPQ
jgi:hypothetical protein